MPAFCQSYDKLKASIQTLTTLSPNSGIAGIQGALNNIQTSLNEFTAAAQSQFGPQTTQLRTSLDSLKKAVQAATATPSSTNISAAATAAGGVVGAYTALQSAVGNRCG
jgi:phage host-nuclease inhibitor protein Gam